jgi:cytochrome c oxidase subunit 2
MCDLVIIFFAIKVWYAVKQDLPPAQQTIRVVGQQWAWTFVDPGPDGKLDTPDDIATVNQLHVQVDTLYHFTLESKDVLHSFSVPVFRLKQDVIPGRVITGWFTPTKTGEYDIQCVEICGIGHGLMGARIHVETPQQHAAWVAQNSPVSVAAASAPPAAQE